MTNVFTCLRKKSFHFFTVLLLLLIVGVGNAWGTDVTGTINFGNGSGDLNINAASVSGNDDQSNTWYVVTTGTTSYTPNASYAQVGKSTEPAKSITISMKLPAVQTFSKTNFSAKFGGFSSTAGTITLKVTNTSTSTTTSVGTGSLSGTSDVTVSSSSAATGDSLTVTVTGISKGVKCYWVSYTYTPVTYTVAWEANGNDWSSHGSPSTSAEGGGRVSYLPTAPTAAACDGSKVFRGWTATPIVGTQNTAPADLFSTAAGAPLVSGNVTYYAVFATSVSVSKTLSFDITPTDFNSSSYNDNNNEKTTTATATDASGVTMDVNWTSYQVMLNSTNMQWQKSNGYIYNSTDLGTINSVTVTSSAGSFTTYYGTTSQPSSGASGSGKGYFKTSVGGATGTTSNVNVNFTKSVSVYSAYATSCCSALATLNGSVSWSGGSATVSWDAADGCGSWALKYKRHADSDIPANWTSYAGSFGTATGRTSNSTAISSLTAGTEYDFQISGTSDGSVYCSGTVGQTVSSTVPKITVSSSLDDFGYPEGEAPEAQTFTVSGTQLTGNLTVDAPDHFLVSLDGSSWSSAGGTKTITVSTPPNNLSSTTIYVKAEGSLSEGDDPSGNIAISGGGAASVNVAVAATIGAACTAPNHVDISGRWDRFGGETISLTATAYSSAGTGSPIAAANITGYQWQKWNGSSWDNVSNGTVSGATTSGATSANLQITNCSKSHSGTYQCVVSTGTACSTASSGTQVKVFVLECYNGGTKDYNFTRVSDTESGTLELNLSANTDYTFKFHVDNKYFGHNGDITADVTNLVCYERYNDADASNITIKTGVEGGKFLIGMEYSSDGNNSNEGEPEISVTYPKKTLYLDAGGSSLWDKDGDQFAIYYQRNSGENSGWTDILSVYDCEDVYPGEVPLWHGVKVDFVRLKSTATNENKANWWTSYKDNQTDDITVSASYNKYTITGWNESDHSAGTFTIPTYTVSFDDNSSDGGSDMTDVDDIACLGSTTLAANTWTKDGYTFTHWTADVDVTANGSSVAAGGVIPDEAELTNITSDIELTAVWAANHTLSYSMNGGDGTSCDGTTTYYTGQSFTTCSGAGSKTGNTFNNWLGSNSVSYAASTTYTMPDANLTLTAQWTPIDYTVTMAQTPSIGSTLTGGTSTAHYGGTINISATEPDGYAFDKWTSSDGITFANASSKTTSFTMPAKNVTVTANFKKIHTVSWYVNGSSYSTGVVDGNTYVIDGEKISDVPTAPANNTLNNCANKFMGWSTTNITKGSPLNDDDDIENLALFTDKAGSPTISGNTDFYAVFAEQTGEYEEGTITITSADFSTGSYQSSDQTFTKNTSYGFKYQQFKANDNGTPSTWCSNQVIQARSNNSTLALHNTTLMSLKRLVIYKASPTANASTWAVYEGTSANPSENSVTPSAGDAADITPNYYSGGVCSGTVDDMTETPYTYTFSANKTYFAIAPTNGALYFTKIVVTYVASEATYSNYVTQCADTQVRVTYDFNGGTGTACTEGVTTKNASYTVCSTEPSKDYYDFNKWLSSADSKSYAAGETYNLQATTTFTAQWTPTVYTITYNLNGGTQQVTPAAPTSYTYVSSDVTLPTPTKDHDRFDGWYANSDLSTGGVQTTIAAGSHGDTTYWAKWTTRHTIKFYADDVLLETLYRASDENVEASVAGQGSLPASNPNAPTDCSSKVFVGWTETWFNDETDTEPGDLDDDPSGKRTEDKTYYAVWATRSGDVGSYTYSAYSTTCCSKQVTLSDGSPSNGTVTFNYDYVWTCKGTRDVTMTVTPNTGYYLSAWSTSGVSPSSVVPAISYGSVSNSGAQVTTVTFAKNTTAGTYTASATFSPIPVSSLTLHAIKKDNTSATIFEETGNDVALSLYPTEGKTASPADPLGHTVKIDFGAVLPTNALTKTYTWSATVNGEDVGWSSNDLVTNSVLEFNKNSGKVVAKSAGTAEIIITADDGSGVTAKVTITVTNVAMSSVSVSPTEMEVYAGEKKPVAVTFTPANATDRSYSAGSSYTYLNIQNKAASTFNIEGKTSVTDANHNETVTVTTTDGSKTATIDVTVKPLPTVTFVDLIHNKTDFANSGTGYTAGTGVLISTVSEGVVSHAKKTPTHTDLTTPASGNDCEIDHLHLMGWIRSDYSEVADYMAGERDALSISEITNAGADYWFLPDADINMETYNGKTFYAVWAVEE